MSIVSLLSVKVINNPAKFTDPYEFEITFECLEALKHDLEWKLTYVGSSHSSDYDQELDSILVGPVPVGINKFLFQAEAPSPELIPANELVSVTVILLSCSYKDVEFVRVGYYVNNEYDTEELRENPQTKVQIDHVIRNILAEKPRVTRFNIKWDHEENGSLDPYLSDNQIFENDDEKNEISDNKENSNEEDKKENRSEEEESEEEESEEEDSEEEDSEEEEDLDEDREIELEDEL